MEASFTSLLDLIRFLFGGLALLLDVLLEVGSYIACIGTPMTRRSGMTFGRSEVMIGLRAETLALISLVRTVKGTCRSTRHASQWVTVKGPDMGIARVSLDGVALKDEDLYSPAPLFMSVRTVAGLPQAKHTLVIRVPGNKNPSANDTNVAVDAFVVGNTKTEENGNAVQYGKWRGLANSAASGGFTEAGGVSANNIGMRNGQNWSALGSGVDGGVLGDRLGVVSMLNVACILLVLAGMVSLLRLATPARQVAWTPE